MTKEAQLFIEELEKNNLKHLPVRENDGRTIVPLGFNLKNTTVEIWTVFNSEDNSVAIRCMEYMRISEDQFPQALLCCNDLNKKMRWAKFYVDDDLDICIEDDAIVDDITAGEEMVELVMRMAAIADEAYPQLNRAIWA